MSKEYDKSILENEDYKNAIREYNKSILKKHWINYESFDENSPVFFRRPEGLEESICTCKEEGISYETGGAILTRSAEDIRHIVYLCKNYKIPYHDNDFVFKFNAEHIRSILEVCRQYNIEFNNFMLDTTPSRIAENATYIGENYGSMYRHPLALVQESERVREVFPYLQEKGYLDSLISSGTMVTLPLGELRERDAVLGAIGEEAIINGKPNAIFALSSKKYHDKYESIIATVKNGQFAGGTKK